MHNYHTFCTNMNEDELPEPDNLEWFFMFLDATIPDEVTTSEGKCTADPAASPKDWISAQMRASLPDGVATLGGLKAAIKHLAVRSEKTASDLLDVLDSHANHADIREKARRILEDYISGCYDNKCKKAAARKMFVSGIILADLEEVLNAKNWKGHVPEFFGPVKTVHPGYGGREGASIVLNDEEYERMKQFAAGTFLGSKKKAKRLKTDDLFDAIREHLKKKVPDDILQCLGMRRVEIGAQAAGKGSGVILVIGATGRLVTIVDVEHMCCKLYLLVSRCIGTRAFNMPSVTTAHCYPRLWLDPVKYKQEQQSSNRKYNDLWLAGTMEEIVKCYENILKQEKKDSPAKQYLTMPDHFKMLQERQDEIKAREEVQHMVEAEEVQHMEAV